MWASWDVAGVGAAVGAAVGSVVTAFVTAWITYRKGGSDIKLAEQKARDDHDSADRRTAIGEWQAIVVQYREQTERRDLVIDQLQKAVGSMQRDHSDCREENAELRTAITFVYDHMSTLHKTLTANGKDPGPLPRLPVMKERPRRAETEFLLNQAKQSSQLVKEGDKVILSAGTRTPGGPNDSGAGKSGTNLSPPKVP